MPWLWRLVGFLPFYGLDSVDINVLSFEHYRGDSRGIEITLLDLLLLSMRMTLPRRRTPPPMLAASTAYAVVVTLSAVIAFSPLFAIFSVWKLARMLLLVRVVARGAAARDVPPEILRGMAFGTLYEFGLVLQQRYVLHMHQACGNFPHQNTLGMALNLVLPAVLALHLAGIPGRLSGIALVAGAVSVVLTLSRGALTMMGIGWSLVYVASVLRKNTPRKRSLGLRAVLGATALLVRAWDSLVDRFTNAPKESAEGREQFEAAAALMLREHPLGMGINQYSLALEQAGYGARVGILGYDASGIVHNIYWLTAAETGYLGLAVFLALLGAPVVTALRAGLRARRDVRGDVLIGFAVGLLLLYAQGTLEWALRQTTLSYLFWTIAGVIDGLARQLASDRARGFVLETTPS